MGFSFGSGKRDREDRDRGSEFPGGMSEFDESGAAGSEIGVKKNNRF